MNRHRLTSLLVTFVAGFFGRFLGSEGSATVPASFFLLFVVLITLIIVYRALSKNATKRKKIILISLVGLIYVLVVCLSHQWRFLILDKILAFLGVTTTFSYLIWNLSSGRPPLDLNQPPALLDLNLPPAVEPEPASTSDLPQQEVERIEEHIRARLIANSPPGTNPDLLFNQARETAQLKRQIVDRMSELDPDHSDFWVQHRDAIILDSILTNRKTDYSPHSLSKMVVELTQGEAHASHTYKKMCVIRYKFSQLGTFKY